MNVRSRRPDVADGSGAGGLANSSIKGDSAGGRMSTSDSWSTTEVRSVQHTHTWTIRGFSQCDQRYLETTVRIRDMSSQSYLLSAAAGLSVGPGNDGTAPLNFRIRLHPQGNKESNKDFSFFQVFCNQNNTKYRAKFSVFNGRGEEVQTTVYTGTQQLHGYFEYIRRDVLVSHIQPDDELQLVLTLVITFDTVTKSSQFRPQLTVAPKTHEVATDLEGVLREGRFSDFVVEVGDREIPVHRVILCARSPWFAAMLQPHTEEAQTGRLVVVDVDFDTMHDLLYYLYSGKAKNLACNAFDLLAAADRFQLNGLKDMAETHLRTSLQVDTVCRCLVLADMHNARELKQDAVRYIASNAPLVIQTEGWRELTAEHSSLITEVVSMISGGSGSAGTSSSSLTGLVPPPTDFGPSSAGSVDPPAAKRSRFAPSQAD